jgi:hypothetical protein
VQLRKSRLRAEEDALSHKQMAENTYLDIEKVEDEVKTARRFFAKQGWPVIDVTRRSVEETAAEIQIILQRTLAKRRKAEQAAADDEETATQTSS